MQTISESDFQTLDHAREIVENAFLSYLNDTPQYTNDVRAKELSIVVMDIFFKYNELKAMLKNSKNKEYEIIEEDVF